MKTLSFAAILALLTALAPLSADAGTRIANKEGMIGTTTGGIAGGVIGHQQGRGIEGAVIGTVAGYALGTHVHRHKDRQKQARRQNREYRRQLQLEREIAMAESATAERRLDQREYRPPEPQYTRSEERQILLQSSPLYTVRRD